MNLNQKKQENFFVGTYSGTIRIMSPPDRVYQPMKLKRGDNTIPHHQPNDSYAVRAMDIHYSQNYIIAGYGSGLIVLWNI